MKLLLSPNDLGKDPRLPLGRENRWVICQAELPWPAAGERSE